MANAQKTTREKQIQKAAARMLRAMDRAIAAAEQDKREREQFSKLAEQAEKPEGQSEA
jgi:hypothetical protein